MDLRRWRAWRRLGEGERRWPGLGVEDGYGRRGEGEGEVDMGRRWRAWRRLGERERWLRRLGVEDRYGRRGEQEPGGALGGRGRWTWGGGGVLGGASRSGSAGGGGWAWGSRTGGGGSETPSGAGGGRGGWTWGGGGARGGAPGGRERRERGPGGSWWRLGERERREWVVEARWRCGECGRWGWVCRAGGERERRRLRDRASSLESGQSGGVGRSCQSLGDLLHAILSRDCSRRMIQN